MVRPDTRSDLKALSPYSGPHWQIGKKNCSPRTSFWTRVWFLNRCSGSSGKKISPSLRFSFWRVVCFGGRETRCTSRLGWGRGGDSTLTAVWGGGLVPISWSKKLSTLLEFITIVSAVWWVFPRKTKGKCFPWRAGTAWKGIYRARGEEVWGRLGEIEKRRTTGRKEGNDVSDEKVVDEEVLLGKNCLFKNSTNILKMCK